MVASLISHLPVGWLVRYGYLRLVPVVSDRIVVSSL